MQEQYPQQPRFFSEQVLHSSEYFKEGKLFTSNKEILATANKIFYDSKEVCLIKGSLIYSEGEKSDYAYFLVEGGVALLSTLADYEVSQQKHPRRVTQSEKKQIIANALELKPSDLQFETSLFCPGNILEKRVFTKLECGSSFGLSEMLKAGIRPFTAVTTQNSKVIMFHKKQFESSLSAFESKRQDTIITPMCKQFVGSRGKDFLFCVFPFIAKTQYSFGEVLYNEGDSPFAIYFIVKGEFQIYKKQKLKEGSILVADLQNTKESKDLEIPIRKKQEGEFMGIEEVVLKHKRRQFSVRSTQASIIYKIEAKKFIYFLEDFAEIRKGLQKYAAETHQRNRGYAEKMFENIQSGFKVEQSTHLEDQKKLAQTVHRELYSGKKRSKTKSNEIIRGYSVNMRLTAYQPEEKGLKSSFLTLNNGEQAPSVALRSDSPQKTRSKSIDLRKSARTAIDNNIKMDEKAYKRVMIKMGTYNAKSNTNIFKSRPESQYKNNFEPIIDQIVRRHNTFLTKLDQKKRKEFVQSKFREVVDNKSLQKSVDKESTLYKTWTVRSMKRSMKKYEQSINTPTYSPSRKQTHQEILSKFDGIMFPSSTRQSRTSRGNGERNIEWNGQISQTLTKRQSTKGSTRNKLVIVNHMMKPLVYYHNS